ncbi:MAG: pantoate--beta-alanine ligase [Actinomycetales bacterium]|nr:pantoate--beta-alanine ligase [Actinomycetales bacterium]
MTAFEVLHTRAELDAHIAAMPRATRAVVMTMGALHEGHASLIRAARAAVGTGGTVVVTVYVNALQFNDLADLQRYPRTLEADVVLAGSAGADVVWAPQPADVFPHGPKELTTDASQFPSPLGPLGEVLEGAARPGHFTGMLTVVRALLAATDPALAFFGEKDYQQLALIRRMVHALHLPVQVVGAPTVREADGLAMSSRNRFLEQSERQQALALSEALSAAAGNADTAQRAFDAASAVLDAAGIDPDYLALIGEDFTDLPETGPARMLIAAKVGDVRLIDNAPLTLGSAAADASGTHADAAVAEPTPISQPSAANPTPQPHNSSSEAGEVRH